VDVEECYDVAFLDSAAVDVRDRSANLCDSADADMTGNDRVGNARQLSVQQMNVGAAHFRIHRVQQGAAWLELRRWKLP